MSGVSGQVSSLAELRAEYVQCRSLGHSWDDIPVTSPSSFGVYMWFRCTRCTSERRDIISPFSGDLLSRKYIYAEGYLQNWERPAAQDLRLRLLALRKQQQEKNRAHRRVLKATGRKAT